MSENLNLHTIDTVDVSPFKKLVMTIGELPTSFVESMTYYEALAWFVKYLQTVIIPTVNNNAEAIEELQDLFTTLYNYVHDYFANLDVQEEINNKLDEMAEDGTLADIIAAYIQLKGILAYNTVADMKNATNLVDGSFAETYGFYTKGDGGGAKYKIRTITNDDTIDESLLIEITADPTNTLVAELIMQDEMNVAQFGCVGDGTTDETTKIQNAISSSATTINFQDKSYLAARVKITSPKNIKGCKTELIINTGVAQGGFFVIENTDNVSIDGFVVKPLTHTFTQNGRGIVIDDSHDITITNTTFLNMNGDGIAIQKANNVTTDNLYNIWINHCLFKGSGDGRDGVTIFAGNRIYIENNVFDDQTKSDMPGCVNIEPYFINNYINVHDIVVRNNNAKCKGRLFNIGVIETTASVSFSNIEVSNNSMNSTTYNGALIGIDRPANSPVSFSNIVVKDNYVLCNPNCNRAILLSNAENMLIENNTIIDGCIVLGGDIAWSAQLPCTNIEIYGNTITKTTNSSSGGWVAIIARAGADQSLNISGNRIIYQNTTNSVRIIRYKNTDSVTADWINICGNIVTHDETQVQDSYLCYYEGPTTPVVYGNMLDSRTLPINS